MSILGFEVPMRGTIEGLPTPRPIGEVLPAALQEDGFCRRMVTAFDELLAPIFTTMDCFDSYIDAQLAPEDFLDWLAGWVGLDVDETWTLERRRELVRQATVLYRIRGTASGLSAHLRLYCGVSPEISDSGGCEWSRTADTPFPGSAHPHLHVRLIVEDGSDIRRSTVSRIIDASRPAHIPFDVEIVVGGTTMAAEEATGEEPAAADAPGAVDLPGSDRIELAAQGPATEEEGAEPGVASEPDETGS